MNAAMKEMLTSKKFLAALIAMVAYVAAHFGLQIDQTEAAAMLAPLLAYIVGQGFADTGKSAAVITAAGKPANDNAPPAPPIQAAA